MFPPSAAKPSFYVAASLILASEILLVLSGFSIRQLSGHLHTAEIVFLRNLFGLSLFIPWLISNGIGATRTDLLRFHIMRAAVGVSAMTCLYYSWANLPMAQAALLKQTAPFFTPLIAFWWLGERASPLLKWSLLTGFLGVLAIVDPQDAVFNSAVLIAIAGAVLGSLAKVTVRRLAFTEGPQRIVFYFALFSTLISAFPALYFWKPPTATEFIWLVLLACTSTLAQLFLSKGYSMSRAGQLAPFTYASIAFAALLGWLFWDELLDWNTLMGVVLVVAAGVMAIQSTPVKAEPKE